MGRAKQDNLELWARFKELKGEMSLREWCEKYGFSYSAMHQRIMYRSVPKADELKKIADALNTTPEYLLTGYDSFPADPRLTILKELIKDSTKMQICEALMNASNEQIIAVKLILGV